MPKEIGDMQEDFVTCTVWLIHALRKDPEDFVIANWKANNSEKIS